jgi:hypothetical protein
MAGATNEIPVAEFRNFSGTASISLATELIMSITIQLDLPEDIAAKARAKGLLDPETLARLIRSEMVSESALKNYREMVESMRGSSPEINLVLFFGCWLLVFSSAPLPRAQCR